MNDSRIKREEDINFLTFWGRCSRESVMRMPLWKRKQWIKMTNDNLKILYGTE